MSNPIRKLISQTAVYGLSSIVGRLLNYLLVPLYTSVFTDPAHYGVVSELYAWVAFLIVILTFGMETAFFRFIQTSENKEQTYLNSLVSVLGINALLFAALLFFNNDIATIMLYEGHNEYIILLGIIVCVDAISAIPLARLRVEEKSMRFVSIQLTSILVNVGLNLFLMLYLFDPERPEEGVLFILLANLCASLVKPIMLYDSFNLSGLKLNWVEIKLMLFYAFPLVIGSFAGIINETIDRILLKQILYNPNDVSTLHAAESEVGIYSACYKLAMLITILLQAYRYAAEPFFFNQMKNQDRNVIYVKVMNLFVATVCLVFLFVSLNIDLFKHFIQNESYWDGLKVVPILLLANVFLGIYYNQSIWYKLSGKTQYGAYIALFGATLTIVMNILFIPKYGYMASAWATFIVYGLQMLLSYFLGQRHYPIPYNLKKFVLYLGLAFVLYFLGSFIQLERYFIQFILQNTLIFVYLLFVWKMEKSTFSFKGAV
ncbi:MAG: oligosaccharide flippase family protein [Crocinitomicaceae bacterium]